MTISAELIDVFEDEAEGFTGRQHTAIAAYGKATETLKEGFTDLEWLDFHGSEEEGCGYGMGDDEEPRPGGGCRDEVHHRQMKATFALLYSWRDALDTLAADLEQGDECRLGEAAVRLLTHEANQFFRTLNMVRRTALVELIGDCGPGPVLDSGAWSLGGGPTRIQLDGTALAENR